jgi:hypothetical protein
MTRHGFISVCIVIVSIALAWWLSASGAVEWMLTLPLPHALVAFLAGLCFTSVFTTAPAIVVLGAISVQDALIPTVLYGGAGAALGDLCIMVVFSRFVHGPGKGMGFPLPHFLKVRRVRHALSHGPLRIFLWITGAFIIASPFPDEAGLALMGISRMPMGMFVPLTFVFNSLGIMAIGFAARAL